VGKVRLNFKGKDVLKRMHRAAPRAIDSTMAEAVIEFKTHHPGWKNRTSNAEGSVTITQPAKRQGNRTRGRWGSRGVNYMLILELKRGSALRNAADVKYKKLPMYLKRHMKMGAV